MGKRIPVIASFAIYDGRDYLGDVAELGTGQWAAFNPDAVRLGLFDDRGEAERLILSRRLATRAHVQLLPTTSEEAADG